MNNINKGLHTLNRSSVDSYFDMMYECSIEEHFEMIFDRSADEHFEIIFSDTEEKTVVRNETETWLYDAKCENYERVLEMVKKKTPYNNKFTLPEDQIVSYFHSFLTEHFIEKNQLKKEIDKGKEIKPSVVYAWFIQYVVREKYQEGQDALQRCSGARTQSEVSKVKSYETKKTETPYAPMHHIKNLESQGHKITKLVSKFDADTGKQVGETEWYVCDDEDLSVEEKSTNAYMKTLLLEKYGEDQLDMLYSLWLEFRYEEYESKKKWAKSRNVTYKVLTAQITQIKDLFIENRADFGF